MKKKRLPEKSSPPIPDIIHEEIGSGMTVGTRTTYRGAPAAEGLRELLERPTRGFFGDLEDALYTFLQAEGPPPPLRILAKEERSSMRWYAVEVLKELGRMERHLARAADAAGRLAKRSSTTKKAAVEGLRKVIADASYNAALAAFRAGTMNQEARGKDRWDDVVLAYQRVREGGGKGGRHDKRRLGIEQAIRERLETSPRISARALWDQFMRDFTFRVGEYTIEAIDADKGIEDQKLCEEGGPSDSAKYLKFRAFKGYVSRLKKETA